MHSIQRERIKSEHVSLTKFSTFHVFDSLFLISSRLTSFCCFYCSQNNHLEKSKFTALCFLSFKQSNNYTFNKIKICFFTCIKMNHRIISEACWFGLKEQKTNENQNTLLEFENRKLSCRDYLPSKHIEIIFKICCNILHKNL